MPFLPTGPSTQNLRDQSTPWDIAILNLIASLCAKKWTRRISCRFFKKVDETIPQTSILNYAVFRLTGRCV
jgi:hypothetical protein